MEPQYVLLVKKFQEEIVYFVFQRILVLNVKITILLMRLNNVNFAAIEWTSVRVVLTQQIVIPVNSTLF